MKSMAKKKANQKLGKCWQDGVREENLSDQTDQTAMTGLHLMATMVVIAEWS